MTGILHEIDEISNNYDSLTEGRVRVEVLMLLDEVISSGKITNSAQESVITTLITQLENQRYDRLVYAFERVEPNGDITNVIRNLESDELVSLANELKSILVSIEDSPIGKDYFQPYTNIRDWLYYATRSHG